MTKYNPESKKILIMDDEVVLMRMYQEKFEQQGYTVYTAVDGELGMDLFIKHAPDIVLCDVMMPGTTGLDFLASKKELNDDSLLVTPVIMLTNLDAPDIINKAKELGAIGYISKPKFDPKDVVNEVEQVLEQRG